METIRNSTEAELEQQVLNTWIDDPEANIAYTHMRVDADAALSAALIQIIKPELTLSFVSADTCVEEDGAIGLDMLNGSQAIKGLSAGSAFGLIVQTMCDRDVIWKQAFGKWAKQLNLTDSGKRCRDSLLFVQLVRAWRQEGLDDPEIVQRTYEILRGHLSCEKSTQFNRNAAKSHPIENRLAFVGDGENADRRALFHRGARVVVMYGESTGICMMLSPKEMKKGRSLGELDGFLPDHWFIHPDGFIAAHGTKKAPQSMSTSGITIDELRTLLIDWFDGKLFEDTIQIESDFLENIVEEPSAIKEDAHQHHSPGAQLFEDPADTAFCAALMEVLEDHLKKIRESMTE